MRYARASNRGVEGFINRGCAKFCQGRFVRLGKLPSWALWDGSNSWLLPCFRRSSRSRIPCRSMPMRFCLSHDLCRKAPRLFRLSCQTCHVCRSKTWPVHCQQNNKSFLSLRVCHGACTSSHPGHPPKPWCHSMGSFRRSSAGWPERLELCLVPTQPPTGPGSERIIGTS